MPPVRDAVRLVDDEQAAASRQIRKLLLAEARVVEALRTHEQDVDSVLRQGATHVVPVLRIRRVHRHGTDPRTLRRTDLVPHQRQQRTDDDCRPGPFRAPQRRGDEVDRGLPPPRPLHHECAPPPTDERFDGVELPIAEVNVVAPDEAS